MAIANEYRQRTRQLTMIYGAPTMTEPLSHLEAVPLRLIWRDEEKDFTPWLADNLDHLVDAVDLDLELIEREHLLPDNRRVDILARERENLVVIENQLETSDGDHFARLIHYAHQTGAKTMLWIAPDFGAIHAQNVQWLNSRYNVDIRCIEVSAWRLGDNYAPLFRQIVPNAVSTTGDRAYRLFFRPLLRRLAAAGFTEVQPEFPTYPVSRWFATPVPNVLYGIQYGDVNGNSWAFILFDDEENQGPVYQSVASHRDEILVQLSDVAESGTEDNGSVWLGFKKLGTLDDLYELQEPMRDWMFNSLAELKHAADAFMP